MELVSPAQNAAVEVGQRMAIVPPDLGFVALCRRAHAVTPSQQTPHIFEILGTQAPTLQAQLEAALSQFPKSRQIFASFAWTFKRCQAL